MVTAVTRRFWAYGGAVFVTAAAGLIMEIVAGRLLAPYVGMSLYTWTAIIAVVLAGFAIGHWIGGALAGPGVKARHGARRVALALALASASSLATLILLRSLSTPILASGLGPVPAIILLTAVIFLLPSLCVGIVSPILTKLAVDDAPGDHGRVIGRMYALGAVGSIAGTLAAGYIFISWIGSVGTVVTVAAIYAAMAIAFAVRGHRLGSTLALLAVVGGLLGLTSAWGNRIGLWGGDAHAFRSPCRVESNYYCIRIDDFSARTGRPSAVMVLDHLAHSINDRDDPGMLYSPYIHFVDEYARRRLGENGMMPAVRAFFIGGGAYTLPRAWQADHADARMIVAEVDPAVTAAARELMWLRPGPGLDIRHGDARRILQSLPPDRAFDLVFGDAFHDISVPAHLVSREFHRQIARRLRPGGFYVVNVVDQADAPRFLFSLVKTLGRDFASVEVWAEADDLAAGAGRVTYVVVAGVIDSRLATLRAGRGIARTWRRWPDHDLNTRIAAAAVPLLTDDFAPVDRLMRGALAVRE